MQPPPLVTSERAAGYRSMSGWSRGPAYPETERARRERPRAARRPATPGPGGELARPVVATARLHRGAGEPGHRVRRGTAAGALLRAVAFYLGHADRADPDLSGHWL